MAGTPRGPREQVSTLQARILIRGGFSLLVRQADMLGFRPMELHEKTCEPCRGGVPALAETEWQSLLEEVQGWEVLEGHHLEKEWKCVDFAQALAMTNLAGAVCEEQGHHADFELGWGRFCARIWTHKVDGLTEADFILAAKLNRALCITE